MTQGNTQYSSNEIGSLIRKAAIGAGYDAGTALDVARAGVWLAKQKQPAGQIVLDAINSSTSTTLECGCDQLLLLLAKGDQESQKDTVTDAPLLLVGFAGLVAHEHKRTITIENDEVKAVVSPVRLSLTGTFNKTTLSVEISISADQIQQTSSSSEPQTAPISMPDQIHAALNELAAKTYVPATEASRLKGAGAGLTDND